MSVIPLPTAPRRGRCVDCLWISGVLRDTCEHGAVWGALQRSRVKAAFARTDDRICGPGGYHWEAAPPRFFKEPTLAAAVLDRFQRYEAAITTGSVTADTLIGWINADPRFVSWYLRRHPVASVACGISSVASGRLPAGESDATAKNKQSPCP